MAERTELSEADPCVVCGTTGGTVQTGRDTPMRPRRACATCYARFRTQGRLDELPRSRFDARSFLRRLLAGDVTPDETGCIIWPGAKTDKGYGHVNRDGRNTLVSHLVLESLVEPRPSPDHDAAHAPHDVCGNRACVNVAHLRWATRRENMDDRKTDGTLPRGERHGHAKLTADDVREIRRLYARDDVTQQNLSDRFGVTRSMVGSIVRGQAWTHVKRGPS